ncbi:hypothetical protein, partial [Vibrio sp. V39_P1S14PM300]|uniref:hypothetical protein n=1 Tax=Vibrio sp. V39_P1S14PM300 TaxID=1938690 RepID=UPI001F1C687C
IMSSINTSQIMESVSLLPINYFNFGINTRYSRFFSERFRQLYLANSSNVQRKFDLPYAENVC